MAVVALLWGGACDGDETITGTYSAIVFESSDTCDDSRDSYPIELEISRSGGGFRVLVNGAGPLTGDIEDGVLRVTGTVTEADGTRPRTVRLEMSILRRRIVEAKGRVTWEGTFPDVADTCVQDFDFTGGRRSEFVPLG